MAGQTIVTTKLHLVAHMSSLRCGRFSMGTGGGSNWKAFALNK